MNQNHIILKKTLCYSYPFLKENEVDEFVTRWVIYKKLKRFEHLTNHGEIERNMYFIIRGTFRMYYPLETDVTESLAIPNSFYNSYESFLTQKPSKVFLQALSKAEVIGIPKKAFDQVLQCNWNLEKMYRLSLEALILEMHQKDFLLKLSASKRVQYFLDSYPIIFQLIPHKYIASYLHITPETLSRILSTTKS